MQKLEKRPVGNIIKTMPLTNRVYMAINIAAAMLSFLLIIANRLYRDLFCAIKICVTIVYNVIAPVAPGVKLVEAHMKINNYIDRVDIVVAVMSIEFVLIACGLMIMASTCLYELNCLRIRSSVTNMVLSSGHDIFAALAVFSILGVGAATAVFSGYAYYGVFMLYKNDMRLIASTIFVPIVLYSCISALAIFASSRCVK